MTSFAWKARWAAAAAAAGSGAGPFEMRDRLVPSGPRGDASPSTRYRTNAQRALASRFPRTVTPEDQGGLRPCTHSTCGRRRLSRLGAHGHRGPPGTTRLPHEHQRGNAMLISDPKSDISCLRLHSSIRKANAETRRDYIQPRLFFQTTAQLLKRKLPHCKFLGTEENDVKTSFPCFVVVLHRKMRTIERAGGGPGLPGRRAPSRPRRHSTLH